MDVQVGQAHYTDLSWDKNTPKTIVHFYSKTILNKVKTEKTGDVVYDHKVFIKKIVPGDNLLDYDQPATQKDKDDNPVEYQAFVNKQEIQQAGLPLEGWGEMPPEMVPELKSQKIYTVNQLASLPDSAGSKIFGFNMWRRKAQEFLSSKASTQAMEQVLLEKQDLERQLAEMRKRLEAIESIPPKRKPGRPKKVQVEAQ
jgi:hypothetical protein